MKASSMKEANQSAKTAAKRQKPIVEEDRISGLPETIILQILSWLVTEDAVKTGLLSKRWQYLWTHVPNLVFRLETLQSETETSDYDGFFGFIIDKTLILYSSDDINIFYLAFDYNHVPTTATATLESRLSLWLRFASIRQMKQLVLLLRTMDDDDDEDLPSNLRYVMPTFVYNNSSLTKIASKCCDYPPLPLGRHVSWGSLKELIIMETEIQDGVLQSILSGSPLLESLDLRECRGGLSIIDTSASNIRLKTLLLSYMRGVNLELSIPTVHSLHILGDCPGSQFKLLDVSSLVEARFDFQLHGGVSVVPQCCHWLWQLFQTAVNRVERLTVGMWCIQVLSESVSKALCPPLSENSNCKCLTLSTWFEKLDFPGVATLLRSSPFLEKLVVDNVDGYTDELYTDADYSTATDYWTSHAGSFHCLKSVLKIIQIVGLEPQSSGAGQGRLTYNYDGLLEFIEFLLGRANVLEKLVISAPQGTDQKLDNYYGIAKKLLSFPRSSTRAVVLLP